MPMQMNLAVRVATDLVDIAKQRLDPATQELVGTEWFAYLRGDIVKAIMLSHGAREIRFTEADRTQASGSEG